MRIILRNENRATTLLCKWLFNPIFIISKFGLTIETINNVENRMSKIVSRMNILWRYWWYSFMYFGVVFWFIRIVEMENRCVFFFLYHLPLLSFISTLYYHKQYKLKQSLFFIGGIYENWFNVLRCSFSSEEDSSGIKVWGGYKDAVDSKYCFTYPAC